MMAGKLQLSNGYNVDLDQMARLLRCVSQDERPRFLFADIAEAVGIATRQAENLASIARAFGLIKPVSLKPTPLGTCVYAHDPFCDDLGTLWFLHYAIAADVRHIVWNRFANTLVPERSRFTLAQFRAAFHDLAVTHSSYSARTHVGTEVLTVVNAYTQQNFARLAYLVEDGDCYSLGYREPVPPLVLAACIARYRDQHRSGDTALSITDLLSAPNSPGVVCQIPEDRLRAGLEALKTQPGLSLESRADLDQVRLTDTTPDYQWMERYYASRQ